MASDRKAEKRRAREKQLKKKKNTERAARRELDNIVERGVLAGSARDLAEALRRTDRAAGPPHCPELREPLEEIDLVRTVFALARYSTHPDWYGDEGVPEDELPRLLFRLSRDDEGWTCSATLADAALGDKDAICGTLQRYLGESAADPSGGALVAMLAWLAPRQPVVLALDRDGRCASWLVDCEDTSLERLYWTPWSRTLDMIATSTSWWASLTPDDPHEELKARCVRLFLHLADVCHGYELRADEESEWADSTLGTHRDTHKLEKKLTRAEWELQSLKGSLAATRREAREAERRARSSLPVVEDKASERMTTLFELV